MTRKRTAMCQKADHTVGTTHQQHLTTPTTRLPIALRPQVCLLCFKYQTTFQQRQVSVEAPLFQEAQA